MSVAMTTDAVIERRKTVTRRKGWWLDKNGRRLLRAGDTLTLCRKVQGRKPGEPIERLAEVEVTHVTRHHLWGLMISPAGPLEVEKEGFPGMSPQAFLNRFFFDAQGMGPHDLVTRIEWRYVCGSGFCECGGCVL
jgi:hypothetical protein